MTNHTDEQLEFIDVFVNEPSTSIIDEAVAGSGKTKTIEDAANAIEVPPGPMLAVAFNKRIQEELASRLPAFFDTKTLNGLGHGAWMRALGGKRVTLDSDKMFKLAKEIIPVDDNNEDLFSEVLYLARRAKSIGLIPQPGPMGRRGMVENESHAWENLAFEQGFDLTDTHRDLARKIVYKSINQSMQGLIDFDDQIYMSVLFGGVYNRYHTVIVDESQDLSPLNHEQLLLSCATRLIVVGDTNQAIYGFRGAAADSMSLLFHRMEQRGPVKRLRLTNSFRCPKAVAERQVNWVPHFKAFETNVEGEVVFWPNVSKDWGADNQSQDGDTSTDNGTWSINSVPFSGAILCRNNAPLMKLAFVFIKNRRPVKVLGRDIGKSLANTLKKIVGKKLETPLNDALALIHNWKISELEKFKDSESKHEVIHDRAESLTILCEASSGTTVNDVVVFIETLFADKAGDQLILSSGHRAKGLEWKWVMHLDPWRVPSKFALKAARKGNPEALVQENNLNYVIETRSKHTLVLANLEDCLEVGE